MQLIDKTALVAEIEKRKKCNQNVCSAEGSGAYYEDGFILDIINSLDTIEVKEVDLEKELKNLIGNVGQCDRKLAKHFYELGLKAKKGE